MGLSSRLLRLPRPQKFFYTMSLSTGASLITLSLLLNKLSGLYGILAVFTGYHLSPFQLSMYIYSIIGLFLTLYLTPHIRTQSPLHCLSLAWFYVLDSVINAAYTGAFAVTWFLVLAQHNAGNQPPSSGTSAPGAGTIDDTSGFTSPLYNVSKVEVDPTGQDAATVGIPASSLAGADGMLGNAVLTTESMNSIGMIIALWTIRLYFCVIMLAYARFVLRQHIALATRNSANSTTDYTSASASSDLASNPFEAFKPAGQGWPGKIGRIMLSVAPRYFLGSDNEDAAWMDAVGGKFRRSEANKVEPGPMERERRRRSGTGPPQLPTQLQTGQKALAVPLQDL